MASKAMSYIRNAVTYGVVCYLLALLFLFFGGIWIADQSPPPNDSISLDAALGWSGRPVVQTVPNTALTIAEAAHLPALYSFVLGDGDHPDVSPWEWAFVLTSLLFGLIGMTMALCSGTSWVGTAVVAFFCFLGIYVIEPVGLDSLYRLLWQILYLWEEVLTSHSLPYDL